MFGSDMFGFPESREDFVRYTDNVSGGISSSNNSLIIDGLSLQRDTSYYVEYSFTTAAACSVIVYFNNVEDQTKYGMDQMTANGSAISGSRSAVLPYLCQVGGPSVVHGHMNVRRDSDGNLRWDAHTQSGAQGAMLYQDSVGQLAFGTFMPPSRDINMIGIYAAVVAGMRVALPGYMRVYRRPAPWSGGGANY